MQWQDGEEDGKKEWRQDTLNDTRDRSQGIAYPAKPPVKL